MNYICDICNKEYSVRSSLWYHSKKCKASLIIEQQKSPIEQQKSPIEQQKSPHHGYRNNG
jgi:hypothetical protein